MKKILLILSVLFALLSTRAKAQTFTFECVCGNIVAPNCDVCSATVQSRYFCGLYIKKNGTGFKWIDSPYIIKWQGNTAVIQEIIPAAETVSIAMSGTAYGTLDSFKMALNCRCVDGDTTALWHPSDSLNVGSVYRGDTLTIVGRGIVDVAFDSILNKYVITADTAGLGGLPQTLANTSDGTTHTVTLSAGGGSTQLVEGSGIGLATTGTTLNGVVTITATDPSTTNEIQRLDTFAIVSNILRASLLNDAVPFSSVDLSPYLGTGTVTSVAATAPAAGFTITGSPITTTGTFVFALSDDLAALEALSSTGMAARTASNTWALRTITAGTGISVADGSGAAGNPTITNTGVITEVDGSVTNEAWTVDADDADTELITTQTVKFQGGGIVATDYIPGTDILTITGTEVDGSTTNEIQTYGHSGTTTYTNTLSGGGGLWSITGAGIAVISQTGGAITVTANEIDGSISNEGSLTVGAGAGTTSIINSNTSGSTGVTLTAAGILSISEVGNVITLTATETGTGTVTSFSASDFSPLFTTTESTPTTTPALSFTAITQNANALFVGPVNGAPSAPTFRAMVTADIADGIVTYAKIQNSLARTALVNAANSTGPMSVVQGTTDQVLRVSTAGTSLGFGTVATGGITDDAVTYAKLQNVAANNVVLGNISGTNQNAAELTVANLYTLLGMSGTAGRNAYWSGTNTLSNSANWLWDNTNGRVTIIPQVAGLGAGTAALNISPPGAGSLTSMEALRSWGNINGNILSGLYNTNTTSTSNAIETISSGSNAAGDPILQFLIAGSGGAYTSMGLDNSDANKFKLSAAGATYPGNFVNSSFVITQDAVPLYGFNTDAPVYTVDVAGRVRASTHFIGTGGQWSSGNISFGTGAGTGPTLNSVSGTGNSLYVTFTTGTGPATSATIFTATYPTAYPNSTSWVTFSPKVATPVWPAVAASGSDTAITFTVGAAALTASTQYSMNFIFFGN